MGKVKTIIVAGVLAVVVNSLCNILVITGGLVFFAPLACVSAWLLFPATYIFMFFKPYIKSDYISLIVEYLLECLHFFIVFWLIIRAAIWFKKKHLH